MTNFTGKTSNEARAGLSPQERRGLCFHEAGHAVVKALGGARVYRVAVAPLGSEDGAWFHESRKGKRVDEVWGFCEAAGSPADSCIRFDPASGDYGVDQTLFSQVQRGWRDTTVRRRSSTEMYRQIRLHLCAALAGSLAEQIHRGGDVWLDDEADWCDWNDVKVAACYARLLRQRGELERLHAETVRVLQLKEVWPFVERLANALDLTGCLNFDDDSEGLLPAPLLDWPPTPRGEEARLRASIRVPLTTGGAA